MDQAHSLPAAAGANVDDDGLLCPHCGYDLRATESDRCSECGRTFDRAELVRSAIPWEGRRASGRIRAYFRTAWLIMIGSRLLRHEASKPQKLADAARFRWVTAGILALAFLLTFGAEVVRSNGLAFLGVGPLDILSTPAWYYDLLVPWSAGATIPGVYPAGLAALAFYLTGAHGWLIRIREGSARRRESAAALGFYAGAPMLLLAVAVLLMASAIAADLQSVKQDPGLMVLVWSWAGELIGLAALFLAALRIAQWRARVRHSALAGLAALPALLVVWLFGLVALLGVFPCCIGFFWIVIDSFR